MAEYQITAQEVTNMWQRLIGHENKLSRYDAVFSGLRSQAEQLEKDRDNLKNRIATLEEARQRQIKFNTDIEQRVNNYAIILAKPKKFWPF